jgi:site-specific DNA-cytosine methylase
MKARRALTHGSLFAGLGGFDLGLRWAGHSTVWQVEINRYCRKILRRHFPYVARFKDIAKCGAKDIAPVDIVTGGFPCVDISPIGKRAGLAGKHSRLWWQMHRIICELRPPWVIVENVPALRDRGADEVIDAVEKAGYAVWPLVVGPDAIGAPHRRERVWLVCHDADSCDAARAESVRDLSPTEKRTLDKVRRDWSGIQGELAAAIGVDGHQAYGGIMRAVHGIPGELHRLAALGNSCVPQIPMILGSFIRQYEESGAVTGERGHYRSAPAHKIHKERRQAHKSEAAA